MKTPSASTVDMFPELYPDHSTDAPVSVGRTAIGAEPQYPYISTKAPSKDIEHPFQTWLHLLPMSAASRPKNFQASHTSAYLERGRRQSSRIRQSKIYAKFTF
jgi:hypothetical protein